MSGKPAPDISGQRFGRLTVVARQGSTQGRAALWLCTCDCGKTKVTSGKALRQGSATSCGCAQKEAVKRYYAMRRGEGP
jgi:hypothetical protein